MRGSIISGRPCHPAKLSGNEAIPPFSLTGGMVSVLQLYVPTNMRSATETMKGLLMLSTTSLPIALPVFLAVGDSLIGNFGGKNLSNRPKNSRKIKETRKRAQ